MAPVADVFFDAYRELLIPGVDALPSADALPGVATVPFQAFHLPGSNVRFPVDPRCWQAA